MSPLVDDRQSRRLSGPLSGVLSFDLPPALEASSTPEERGLRRDGVRLLVARRRRAELEHRIFSDLPQFLEAGDVLVVNTSATLPAAIDVELSSGERGELHFSSELPAGLWSVELRHVERVGHPGADHAKASTPWLDAPVGLTLALPGGGRAQLVRPLASSAGPAAGPVRLWVAAVDLPQPLLVYLARYGRPIRYGYITHDRPIGAYQTIFADEPGSAEMPSAARPFSAELVTRLVVKGVMIAPVLLHCGVSSLEAHDPPFAERYRIGLESAAMINTARAQGRRVVAVGTTAVRTLETVADRHGRVHPGEGWTELIVTPDRGVRVVDGLITGWHEPEASHLALLETVAGRPLLEASYRAALEEGYLWHEFGDSHLILP